MHYYYKYIPNAGGWGPYLTSPGILDNTWVKMREVALSDNINPEGNNGAGNAQGLEWASYPGMRSISFRLLMNL